MLVFKENVYGFVYDSQYGSVRTVFNRQLTENEVELLNEILSKNDCILVDIEECNCLFEIISKEDLLNDEEGLNKVFDFI